MLPRFPFLELHNWYQKHGRHHLPWRDYNYDSKTLSYRVWLAETMLQQTQVERVKEYFENILETFPTVEHLSQASYEEFFPYYKGLGYYSRARNMLKTAKKVVNDFGGIFPNSTAELRTLPGVGPYTAEAIRAFAYNESTLSFDTNLEKIFSRYYFGNKFQKLTKKEKEELLSQMQEFCETKTSPHSCSVEKNKTVASPSPLEGQVREGVERLSRSGSEAEGWGEVCARDINNTLMDYGATVSLNSIANIDWEDYPLSSSKFYQTRGSLEPIPEKKKSSFPNKDAYIFAILHEDHKKYFSCPESPNTYVIPARPLRRSTLRVKAGIDKKEKVPCLSDGFLPSQEGQNNSFSPFLIGKNTGNPRSMIQEYFFKEFGLEVSVRPPEVKSYNTDEIPYMVCYCQVQSGTHNFSEFSGLKLRGFEEGYVEEIEFG